MDTSSRDNNDRINKTKLQTLIVASIHTLKRNNKKCGNEEVFEIVLESLENDIDRNLFDETLEELVQNQKVKTSCYANRTCLSIPKEHPINNANTTVNDTLKNDFDNFKNLMTCEFNSMKSSFFKEVNSFKNQLLNTSESTLGLQNQNESNNSTTLNILERLISHLEDQVSTLKEQLNRKDKVINILLGKLEKRKSEEAFSRQCKTNNLPLIQTSSVDTYPENTLKLFQQNRNSISNGNNQPQPPINENATLKPVTKPPAIPESSTNASEKSKKSNVSDPSMNHKSNANSQIYKDHTDEKQNNTSSKLVIILGDSMIKHTNGWEIARKLKANCKVYAKSFPGATTQCMMDYMKPSIRAKPDHIILYVGTNELQSNATPSEIAEKVTSLASEIKCNKCEVSISAIVITTDKPDLKKKGIEVNNALKNMCEEKNIFLIDHSKKLKASHLNSSRLHLNRKRDQILGNIFTQHILKTLN